MTPDTLVTTYLHMTDSTQFRPAFVDCPRAHIERLSVPDVAFYRFLYHSVGAAWRWRERAQLSDCALADLITSAQLYVMFVGGAPAGFIELSEQDETGAVEVVYFGLREPYFGQGYGKHLLSYGVARAWESGAERLWLHTCNLDSPHALPNYQQRGFSIYHVEREPMPALFADAP